MDFPQRNKTHYLPKEINVLLLHAVLVVYYLLGTGGGDFYF
jgi:hypothetical protein